MNNKQNQPSLGVDAVSIASPHDGGKQTLITLAKTDELPT